MLYEAFISESKYSRLIRKGSVLGKKAVHKFKRGKGRKLAQKLGRGKGGSLVKSKGGAIVPSGKGGAIVKSPGGKLGKPKGGALSKRPAGGRWAQAADTIGQVQDLRRDRQQYASGIRQDRENTSGAFKTGIDTIRQATTKGNLAGSGSKFGKSVAHGSGVQASMGQIGALAKGAAQMASGAIGDQGRARLGRKGKIAGAKARQLGRKGYNSFQRRTGQKPTSFRDPGLRMQKPGWKKTQKPQSLGQQARRNPALKKKLIQQREEFSCWREDFVWEADKKYPSGEKEKIIDVMKGKNTIEINPTVEDDKYKR